ncbi:alkaline phosphatase family protein [Nocardioides sp. LHG3406-4]|uniref:alkaline phosphatase family protein n=1 Tax=Nocardioides sp. LHG3406-4 TaxID=2804575 RepID=UPI003CF18B01
MTTARTRRPFALATAVAGLVLVAGAACAQATDHDPGIELSASSAPRAAAGSPTSVITVSIDAFNPRALRLLGPSGAPTLHRLIDQGASTLNARTEYEMTVTLPNHTGMVTGRRIEASSGGHGVTWNDDRLSPTTVDAAAGHHVVSLFSVLDEHGLGTALFASKTKFSLWQRSWPTAFDKVDITEGNGSLVRHLIADLATPRSYRFLHLSAPDVAGHAHGFMSKPYLKAIRQTDRRLGKVVAAIDADPALRKSTVLMVTADHGGKGASHEMPTVFANYRVPFIVRGPGVPTGADLYDLNPTYRDPGRSRPTYAGPQPIRNGDVANLVTSLFGLPSVSGSELDAAQDLRVYGS